MLTFRAAATLGCYDLIVMPQSAISVTFTITPIYIFTNTSSDTITITVCIISLGRGAPRAAVTPVIYFFLIRKTREKRVPLKSRGFHFCQDMPISLVDLP